MPTTERPFSDLLRKPKEVTEAVADADVLLRRRDQPDLRLSRADRDVHRAEAFAALGHTIRSLARHSPEALSAALTEALPWTEFLPPDDLAAFVDEFGRTVNAVAAVEEYEALSQLLLEWRTTAAVHANPRLAARLARPVDAAGGPVPPPTA